MAEPSGRFGRARRSLAHSQLEKTRFDTGGQMNMADVSVQSWFFTLCWTASREKLQGCCVHVGVCVGGCVWVCVFVCSTQPRKKSKQHTANSQRSSRTRSKTLNLDQRNWNWQEYEEGEEVGTTALKSTEVWAVKCKNRAGRWWMEEVTIASVWKEVGNRMTPICERTFKFD